jgi:inner membrane protein
VNIKLFLLAAACSVIPDIDVIAFHFGIPYQSQWGHRGFTHSFVFALSLAGLLAGFHRRLCSKPWTVFWFCFLSCASHALLDAMTNGGLGVALYWPFSLERLFFPFRPIQVSPIGVGRFFTAKGINIIVSELIWVLFPALIIGLLGARVRRKYAAKRQSFPRPE